MARVGHCARTRLLKTRAAFRGPCRRKRDVVHFGNERWPLIEIKVHEGSHFRPAQSLLVHVQKQRSRQRLVLAAQDRLISRSDSGRRSFLCGCPVGGRNDTKGPQGAPVHGIVRITKVPQRPGVSFHSLDEDVVVGAWHVIGAAVPSSPTNHLREVFKSSGVRVRAVEDNLLLGKRRIELVPRLDAAARFPEPLELSDGQRFAPCVLRTHDDRKAVNSDRQLHVADAVFAAGLDLVRLDWREASQTSRSSTTNRLKPPPVPATPTGIATFGCSFMNSSAAACVIG